MKPAHSCAALAAAMLFLAAAFLPAQDRNRMTVYVPMPTGGTQSQRSYFQENFKMELIGANYPSVENKAVSVYTLLLDIQDNPDFDRRLTVDDTNARYLLYVKLERSDDNSEVVNFSFPFSDIEAMADWNLYLLYQAMANAYMPPEPGSEPLADDAPLRKWEIERWRNQWLYLSLAAGTDLGFYLRLEDDRIQTGSFMPAMLAGLEFHFLDFLSLELDPVKLHFIEKKAISIAGAATVKIVLNFSTVMLEPYGGVEYALSVSEVAVPPLWVMGGFQVGVQGATRSAWTMDFGVSRNLNSMFSAENGMQYDLMRFHLLGGFKFGFIDRKKAPEIY
jgi:hypothetical protein